jgi:putative phosphotransacetylase
MDQAIIEQLVKKVLAEMPASEGQPNGIPVGVSNRHIHLSTEHLEALFGKGHTLTKEKDLKQEGEFAAKEAVTLVGPKGVIQKVRVLGPIRKFTQIEISRTDGFSLGVPVPVRNSGQVEGSPGIVVAGPEGAVTLPQGLICAARHIHMSEQDAKHFGVCDGETVGVKIPGMRGGSFDNVLVRVHPRFRLEFHIDTDEANAVELKNGDIVTLA